MFNNWILRMSCRKRCSNLHFKFKRIRGLNTGLIVRLRGSVDTDTALRFFRKMSFVVHGAGFSRLVFDLSRYTFTSERLLDMLAVLTVDLRSYGGCLVVTGTDEITREVFDLAGGNMFPVKDTLADSIEFLKYGSG